MLSKLRKTSYVNAAACLLVVAGLILAIVSNSFPGFSFTYAAGVIACSVIGLLAFPASIYCEEKFGTHHYITFIVKLIAVVMITLAVCLIAETRASDVGNLFTWDTQNTAGFNALYTSIAAAALDLVAVIVYIVTSFFKEKKA